MSQRNFTKISWERASNFNAHLEQLLAATCWICRICWAAVCGNGVARERHSRHQFLQLTRDHSVPASPAGCPSRILPGPSRRGLAVTPQAFSREPLCVSSRAHSQAALRSHARSHKRRQETQDRQVSSPETFNGVFSVCPLTVLTWAVNICRTCFSWQKLGIWGLTEKVNLFPR